MANYNNMLANDVPSAAPRHARAGPPRARARAADPRRAPPLSQDSQDSQDTLGHMYVAAWKIPKLTKMYSTSTS